MVSQTFMIFLETHTRNIIKQNYDRIFDGIKELFKQIVISIRAPAYIDPSLPDWSYNEWITFKWGKKIVVYETSYTKVKYIDIKQALKDYDDQYNDDDFGWKEI